MSGWGDDCCALRPGRSKRLQPGQRAFQGRVGRDFFGLAIAAGRLSDHFGRKPMVLATATLCGLSFYLFFGAGPHWAMPILWITGFFGFFAADTLVAGFALEIVPTHYRATVGALRYLIEIGAGAGALALEGVLYDQFGGHGPALQWLLVTIPVTLIAILFLPEPAGKTLEESRGGWGCDVIKAGLIGACGQSRKSGWLMAQFVALGDDLSAVRCEALLMQAKSAIPALLTWVGRGQI